MPDPLALVAYLIAVRAHHPADSHLNWGDVPTWLGVLAASAAAYVVFQQLRSQNGQLATLQDQLKLQRQQMEMQRAETARQTAALERGQAADIEIAPATAVLRLPTSSGDMSNTRCWRAAVRNSSLRPIRNIVGQILPAPGKTPQFALEVSVGDDSYKTGDKIDVLRKEQVANLAFHVPSRAHPDAEITVRFDDDAGLHWQIDHDLHLTPMPDRDW